MKSNLIIKSATALLLLLISTLITAQDSIPWQLTTSANASFSSYKLSDIQQGQSEIDLFVDVSYLDRYGAGAGYIRQDQGLNNRDDIVNDILFLNGWISWYPEFAPGKVNLSVNYYDGSESTSSTSGGGPGPGPGGPGNTDPGNTDPGNTNPGNTDPGNTDPGNTAPRAYKPSPITVTSFEDSLTIVNPVLSFMNYSKTLYLDLSYVASDYKTSESTVGNLRVDQWSPAIGFGFNEQYDWLQFRLFYIDLSSDSRTPGTDNTVATSIGWTRWLQHPRFLSAQKFSVKLLLGERLYGVDSDARKIYNLTDMQTGSAIFGIHWSKKDDLNIYVYSGYEQFRDVANNDDYNSLFIVTGISKQW